VKNKYEEHTPGPWNVIRGKTLWHVETDANHPQGAGKPICSLPLVLKADAELIAMAPDLLKMLRDSLLPPFPNDLRMLATGIGGTQKSLDAVNALIDKWEARQEAARIALALVNKWKSSTTQRTARQGDYSAAGAKTWTR
jgi:hypothetical protein